MMTHFRLRRVTALLLGICLLLSVSGGLFSCADRGKTVLKTEITEALLNKAGDRITVSATLSAEDAAKYKHETLSLFAIEPFETVADVEAGKLKPIAESHGSESMRFTVDFLYDNGMRDRLCQRFLLATAAESGYRVITEGVYVANPEMLAEKKSSTAVEALKGVAMSSADDVTSLAPAHAIIDLPIEQYLLSAPIRGESISYIFRGETLSLSEQAVEELDEQIEVLCTRGSQVYLRPVLTTAPERLGALSVLGDPTLTEARAYALNLGSSDGYFYIAGLFSFLAQRYPAVAGVIPGVSINDLDYHASAISDSETFRSYAVSLLRITYNIFRAENASVRVYLPVNNLYTTDAPVFPTEEDVRNFVSAFAAYAKRTGDFDWSVYVLMRLDSDDESAIYRETGTVNKDNNVTEKYILPQTANLLSELLLSDAMRYNGAVRGMMWGVSLPGDPSSEESLMEQGISLLYTYMKALSINRQPGAGSVHAVIWETLIDSERSPDGLICVDGSLKPSGELFSSLGRTDLSNVIDLSSVQRILGDRYAEIADTLSKQNESIRLYTGKALSDSQPANEMEATLLFGERAGWGNAFSALPGNGTVASKRPQYGMEPLLKATFESGLGSGIYTGRLLGSQLKDREQLVIQLTALLPAGHASTKVMITLDGSANGEICRYIGSGELKHNVWETLAFDITEFAERLDGSKSVTMTLSLIGTGSSGETPTELYLSRIEVREAQNWFVRGGWVAFPVILILIALTVLLVWFFHTYEIHWTPSRPKTGEKPSGTEKSAEKKKEKGKAKKGRKDKKEKKDKKKGSAFGGLFSRTEIRPRSHARIMVKPDSGPAVSDYEEIDEEIRDAEEMGELFDADPKMPAREDLFAEMPLFDPADDSAEDPAEEAHDADDVKASEPLEEIEEIKPFEEIEEIEEIKPAEEIEELEPVEELKPVEESQPIEELKPLEDLPSLEDLPPLEDLEDLPPLEDESTDPKADNRA